MIANDSAGKLLVCYRNSLLMQEFKYQIDIRKIDVKDKSIVEEAIKGCNFVIT